MSLFDILKNSNLSSVLGSLTDKAQSGAATLQKTTPGGVGGLLGAGAVGALLGSVLSKDMLQNAALVGAGAVAWNFYKKWSENRNGNAAVQEMPAAPQQPAAVPAPAAAVDPTAMLLLRAMIYAARADGHVDATEQERIGTLLQQMFPGQDAGQLTQSVMHEPLDPFTLARQVRSLEQGEDLYRLSCLIIDIDHFMERSYLDGLAQGLNIGTERKAALEQEAVQARHQLAAGA